VHPPDTSIAMTASQVDTLELMRASSVVKRSRSLPGAGCGRASMLGASSTSVTIVVMPEQARGQLLLLETLGVSAAAAAAEATNVSGPEPYAGSASVRNASRRV
jgi:hypothetical protein